MNKVYGELEPVRISDERFRYDRFQFLTTKTLNQFIGAIRQNRNLDQISQARLLMMTLNLNRGKDDKPFEDIGDFLPHPNEWREAMQSDKLGISKRTAKQILKFSSKLKTRHRILLLGIQDEIERKSSS